MFARGNKDDREKATDGKNAMLEPLSRWVLVVVYPTIIPRGD